MGLIPIFGGGDIDDNQRWHGEPMGCLECHEVSPIYLDVSPRHYRESLNCGECGEPFATWNV